MQKMTIEDQLQSIQNQISDLKNKFSEELDDLGDLVSTVENWYEKESLDRKYLEAANKEYFHRIKEAEEILHGKYHYDWVENQGAYLQLSGFDEEGQDR